MVIHIGTLRPPQGAHRRRKRIGQGMGSGHGKTATRGSKGQRSRAGSRLRPGFEGGQMPLHRRLPKRGFTNIFKKHYALVNLGRLDKLEGDQFNPERLAELGVVHKLRDGLKILGSGELTRKVRIEAHLFSRSALEKIRKAGGEAVVIGAAAPKE